MRNHPRKIRITRPSNPPAAAPKSTQSQDDKPKSGERKIVIVEDQAAIREMLEETLGRQPNCQVVGTAPDGFKGLEMVLSLRPDLLLIDVVMPRISGIELLRRLGKNRGDIKVLVFSARQDLQFVRALMQEGINGFVSKSAPLKDLRAAVDKVANGGTWFSDDFSRTIREALANPIRHSDGMMDLLTPREREIAVLIARSHSSKEVARLLAISIKTAENHRSNLMRKLAVRDVAGLVRLIIRQGLVDASEI